MFTHQTQFGSTAAMSPVPAVPQTASWRVRPMAGRLRVWLVKQRTAGATPFDFRTMSGRELHDIGLTRVDVPSVGWDAWIDRYQEPHMNRNSTPASQDGNQLALVACSLWLMSGFIGASALAAGMLQLFEGPASPLSALTLVVCGGILAAASWHRARAALGHAVQAPAVAQYGSSAMISQPPRRASQPRTVPPLTPPRQSAASREEARSSPLCRDS
jgi:uncharacterized protein YjiS (DUF1127 family)